ncbi:MAG: leucyl aminopeptidase [Deltaproteobacteria bacterium]|nr:leucyl aminopeptidase [Deltaproteobacteria bacterium]
MPKPSRSPRVTAATPAIRCSYQSRTPGEDALGCLVFFLTEETPLPPKEAGAVILQAAKDAVQRKDFAGKGGDELLLPGAAAGSAKGPRRLLLIGLGKAERVDAEALRRAAGRAAQRLVKLNLKRAGLWLPEGGSMGDRTGKPAGMAQWIAEGALLGAYRFQDFKSEDTSEDKRETLMEMVLYDPRRKSSAGAMGLGVTRAEAVALARSLGNTPANVMTPDRMAQEAAALAKRHKLKHRVLGRAEMEKLGMGLLLGVAGGSQQPPRLIVLEYRPAGAKGTLAFVGKGLTFDSGGISIKPSQAMDEMKFDMCGGAAVLGAMEAIARLKPKVNVIGLVPACENLPDGAAVKPGDILTAYSGKKVEVLNTDAEGRLVLADALAWGIKTFKPDAVVDLATLTGACVVALGHYATGAVGNHEGFTGQVTAAGQLSGDIVWPLPNFPEYEEGLKGKYGDLQNIAGRDGGAITAGLFLKQFVGEVPWVHLDIAGTAWDVKNVGHIPNAGATGVGVRLLVDLAMSFKGL